jgi:hypothetical protein
MPKVIKTETTVFQYSELSKEAQEVARDWFREASTGDTYWAEYIYDDADTIAKLFGLEIGQRSYQTMGGKTRHEPAIYWSGFSCQGDGASFEGTYHFKAGALNAIKEHAPQDEKLHSIVADLEAAGVMGLKITTSGHYSHSGSMSFELLDYDAEGNDYDNDATTLEQEVAASKALRRFADWIYSNLEKEYEYRNSDETVADDIIANEYEFTEDGKRYV